MNNGENLPGREYISVHDPGNILWQLFRIWVEETEVPESASMRIKNYISTACTNGES